MDSGSSSVSQLIVFLISSSTYSLLKLFGWGVRGGGVASPFTKNGNVLSPIMKIMFPYSQKKYLPNNRNHHSLEIHFPIHHYFLFIFTSHQVCSFTISPTLEIHIHVLPTLNITFMFHKKKTVAVGYTGC